jgi:WD40 repeat protein
VTGARDRSEYLTAAFSSDGTQLYTSTRHDGVEVLDIATDRVVGGFPVEVRGPAGAGMWLEPLATDPHGRLLLAAHDSGSPAPVDGGQEGATGSPAATAAPAAEELVLIDPASGTITASANVGQVPLVTWEWSSDGSRLVVGTQAGEIQVLDTVTLEPVTPRVRAHSGYTLGASFSPDGSMVVTSGSDGNVAFWDAQTLRGLGSVVRLGPTSWVWAWYLPDGRVAGMMPSTPARAWPDRLFSMPGTPSAWLADACTFAGRDLSPDEWARIVTDQPYRPICPTNPSG